MQRKKWLPRIGIVLASLTWGAVVFAVSFALAFPSEPLLERIQWEVQEQSSEKWALDATDLSLWWAFPGASLHNAVIYKRQRSRRRSEEGSPLVSPVLQADRLSVRVPLRHAFTLNRVVAFEAEMWGGEIEGLGGTAGTRTLAQLSSDDINMALLPVEGDGWSIDLGGTLEVDIDMELDTEDTKKSDGDLRLEAKELTIIGGMAMGSELGDMDMLPIVFTEAIIEGKVDDGALEITNGRLISEAVQAEIGGQITLNKNLSRSRSRLEITLTFADEIDTLVKLIPDFKNARDDEGKYHFQMSGSITSPNFRPDRSKARGYSRSTSNRGTRSSSREKETDDERQTRLDRLRERREEARKRREERSEEDDEGRPSRAAVRAPDRDEFDEDPPLDDEEEFDDGEPRDEGGEDRGEDRGGPDDEPPLDEPVEGPYIDE